MNPLRFDYLVLGSGIAGLTFALEAAKSGTVLIVCKAALSETNTSYAQGGIAAVLSAVDSFEQHVQDTLVAGGGLCDEAAVRFMVGQAPKSIKWLQQQGVSFDCTTTGDLALGLEGGHSLHRVAHVKDHTGLSIQQALGKAVLAAPNISILANTMVLELLVEQERCIGAQVLDLETKQTNIILAKAVVLATGGSGQLYRHTTNPSIATGDGLAMAYRAGAKVSHMEFFQFHPTALYIPSAKDTFLVSEALRGTGAELVLPDGSRFMHQYHPLGSLAPRDIVARAVYREMKLHKSPCLYLDARHLPEGRVQKQFPFIYAKCKSIGLLAERDLIPIVPAAHYQCGGVETDLHGQTSVTGLYAIGEVACTHVHGANRLASNSLLEGVVFARSAAAHVISGTLKEHKYKKYFHVPDTVAFANQGFTSSAEGIKAQLQKLMWEKAGIVRSEKGLLEAKDQVASLQKELKAYTTLFNSVSTWQLQNLFSVAALVIDACLERKESVGGHQLEKDQAFVAADVEA